MENTLLNKEQINSIWQILKRDIVIPRFKKAVEKITTSEEWTSKEAELKESVKDLNSRIKSLDKEALKLGVHIWTPEISVNNDMIVKALGKEYCFDEWTICNMIELDVKARLQLTNTTDYETIMSEEGIKKHINVDKYINSILISNDSDEDEDDD